MDRITLIEEQEAIKIKKNIFRNATSTKTLVLICIVYSLAAIYFYIKKQRSRRKE